MYPDFGADFSSDSDGDPGWYTLAGRGYSGRGRLVFLSAPRFHARLASDNISSLDTKNSTGSGSCCTAELIMND